MMTPKTARAHGASSRIRTVLLAALAAAGATAPVPAREPVGALDLRIHPTAAISSTSVELEVVLHALVPVRDLTLAFRRSDGTAGSVATVPLGGGSFGEGLSLRAGERRRTMIRLDVPRSGIYEVVASVSADGETGPVATEAMTRVAVGTSLPGPVEREGAAEYLAAPLAEGAR